MSEKITSSMVSGFGDVVPPGTYTAKLSKVDSKEAENDDGTNYVSMTLEILDKGEHEGLNAFVSLFPKVTKSQKNGKYYSRGIFEAQQFCAAWGKPLPEFDLTEFLGKTTVKGARLLHRLIVESFKGAGQPKLRIRVVPERVQEKNERTGKWEDAKNEDGTPKFRNKTVILGRANPVASDTAALDAQSTQEARGGEDEDEAPPSLTFV